VNVEEAKQAVLAAAEAFGDAGLDVGAPHIDGMGARHVLGVRLKLAADALARAKREVAGVVVLTSPALPPGLVAVRSAP
jgi:hypothetical protein